MIIDHIPTDYLSIELTKLTELQRPTDFLLIIKTLSEKFFPLISPPLLLSLSLSLSAIVNSPILLISSHNFLCPQLDPKHKVSSHFLIVNPSSIDKIESSSKQGGKRKVTPTKSVSLKNSLKDPSFTSIPMYFQAVMSYPGSPGAPYFEESNITNSLDNYNQMCTDYQVDKQEKTKRLSWYYELFTGKYIEMLISFSRTSWAVVHKTLRKEYKDQHLN